MKNILLIGAGRMGSAMLTGWLSGTEFNFSVIEPNDVLRARLQGARIDAYAETESLPLGYVADSIVIATKPDHFFHALTSSKQFVRTGGLVLSVAAGISTSGISKELPPSTDIIRCMPNLPSLIGEGMIVCCARRPASTGGLGLAESLMSTIGQVAFIEDEGLMDVVTAISGSGPAYVFHLLETLSAHGISLGLDEKLASLLAKQTVFGAAKMAATCAENPTSLREQVTSPNGTTAAALEELMNADTGLSQLLERALRAACDRSIELGTRWNSKTD